MADTAYDVLHDWLSGLGLPDELIAGAWQQYQQNKTEAEVLAWVREQPAYKAAYPGIEELRASGSPYGSEANYAQYVQNAKELAHAYGIPANLYDQPDDFVSMMKGGVSPNELNQRYQMAASAAYTLPQEVRDSLSQITGLSTGDLIGYYLDADRAIPLLERKFQAAQIMGAGSVQGVNVTEDRASRLGELGVTFDNALQGFRQVSSLKQLGAGLGAAETADQDQLTDAILGGNADAQAQVQRAQKSRQAQFGGGGGAASQQSGATGLGASRTT